VQLKRTSESEWMIKNRPNAFLLLTIIALRACRKNGHVGGLEIGEALLGDYENYGMSRQTYRTELKWLKSNHQVTIKPTTRGTTVTLLTTDVYDINAEEPNHQIPTSQPSANHQVTTNNKIRSKKKKYIYPELFQRFWDSFPKRNGRRTGNKQRALKLWKAIPEEDHGLLQEAVTNYAGETATEYIKDVDGWLAGDRWRAYVGEQEELEPERHWNWG